MCSLFTTGRRRWIVARIGRYFALVVTLLLAVACHTGVYHTVEPGQTLYRIGQTYGVDTTYLARINNISDPTQLRAGTRLYVPGATRHRQVAVVSSEPPPAARPRPAPRPVTKASPPSATTAKPAPKPAPVTPPASTPKAPSGQVKNEAKRPQYGWPLRGRIVREYSTAAQAGGGRGIEIAARAGTDVAAAEAGRVIYSGDGVNGYGFLVILQHEHEMFTVYGFNQRNLVTQGAFVSRGQKIALSGVPPAGGEPRLHFEVRRGKDPVNPLLYLP